MSLWRRIYTERRSALLPLFIVAAVNLAVALLVVLPLRRSVDSSAAAAENAQVAVLSARQQLTQAREAAASHERADDELTRFYTEVLPSTFAAAQRTTNRWVQDAARRTGLEYIDSSFSWDRVRESTLSRASSDVTLRGRYADIRRFLREIEVAPEFLIVEEVELRQPASTGDTGSLEVGLVVSTFFVTERVSR